MVYRTQFLGVRVRSVVLGVAFAVFGLVLSAHATNPIQIENAKPGATDWQVTNYGANHQIEGYANLTSVQRGGQIQFFVNTIDSNFTIEFFRTGWYGGAGARRMTSAVQLPGTAQPPCSNDTTTGLIECNWINPYTLQIPNDTSDPTNWCSGVYLAKLTGASGFQSYIVFVVRDDSRPSDYLFQSSVNTYEAYNNWGGRSLYAYNSDFQARKVSFNRPYVDSRGAGQYIGSEEYPMVRFLEREGYDVAYATDVDIHENANILLSHKADLVVGHGEYWSWQIRANVLAALNQGMSLGVFAANTCYWQVRYEPSVAGGAADRTLVGYKDFALTEDPDYINGDPSLYHLVTTLWRSSPVNLPEDAFIGVMYGNVVTRGDIIVNDASSWVFANTGLQNGSHLSQLMGTEVDGLAGNTPPGIDLLSHSPYQISGQTRYSDMTVYTASSGATFFAAGTIIWSWGLDSWAGGPVSSAAQQMTRNILARFSAGSSISGAIAFVQQSTATYASAGSVTVNLNAAPRAGNAVVLFSANNSVGVTAVSGGGVSWVRAITSGAHSLNDIWYGLNSSGSGTSITVSYASAAGSGGVNVSEFSGVAATNALDVAPSSSAGISTTPTTPTASTTNANDLILAAASEIGVGATTGGPTNSFIALSEAASGNKIVPAYRVVTTVGSYSTSWTEPNGGWDAVIVTLKGSSSISTVFLASVSVSPSTLTGGSSATGTVMLSGAAPSGGASVSLSSTNTSAAQVPSSVTVPAGSTVATFTVTTNGVTSAASVTIAGGYNGTSSTTLTVNPGSVSGSVTLVQQKTATYASASSVAVSLSAAPHAGSALLLFSANNTVGVTAVSGGGVTWVQASSGGAHSVINIWYGLNSSGSGTTITVTYASAAGSGGVNVSEFSGVAAANALDVAPPSTNGISTTPTTPTAVTTNASDLIVAASSDIGVGATTGGPTNSFIALSEAANSNKIVPAYRIVSATGSYSTSWTEPNGGWDTAIVALKSQ